MKKFYLAVFAFLAFTMSKQATGQKKFSLSVIGTPQFSFLQNSDDNDNSNISHKATFRAAFGAGAAYQFSPKAGLGLDVLYSLQGQRDEINAAEISRKQNYVKIPVYFIYTVGGASQPVSFLAKVGPQLSVLTSSKLTDGNDTEIQSNSKDWYSSVTFGGMAGAGAQFKLSPELRLTTLARLDYDFTNAEDDGNPHWPAGRAATHNITAGLEVGLKFSLH